jgi:hypothetical protein
LASALYRARQFVRGFRSTLTADDLASVHALLTEEERALFFGMLPRDRRHSLDMVHWLRAHAAPSDEVLAAALLHDIGKGQLWVWDRVAFVLLGAAGHELRARVAVEGGGRFRDALWRLEHHARLGADRLGRSRPRVAWLVAHHTDRAPPPDHDLALLLVADAAC